MKRKFTTKLNRQQNRFFASIEAKCFEKCIKRNNRRNSSRSFKLPNAHNFNTYFTTMDVLQYVYSPLRL